MDLRTTLQGFADALLATDDPTEAVSVSVRRVAGFQNEATTPDGSRVLIDEPAHFGGRGEAPDPAQYLLAAIGASLSVTLTAHAALRGARIDEVRCGLRAVIDGQAFFHPGSGSPGLLDMTIDLKVRSADGEEAVRALLEDALLATPVIQTLARPPRINLNYEAAA